MWRLVYSKYKLTLADRQTLEKALADFTYTCGAQLSDLGLDGQLGNDTVCVRNLSCYKPLEKLYYSVGTYELICIYCCSNENLVTEDGFYPQCHDCASKQKIKKRK